MMDAPRELGGLELWALEPDATDLLQAQLLGLDGWSPSAEEDTGTNQQYPNNPIAGDQYPNYPIAEDVPDPRANVSPPSCNGKRADDETEDTTGGPEPAKANTDSSNEEDDEIPPLMARDEEDDEIPPLMARDGTHPYISAQEAEMAEDNTNERASIDAGGVWTSPSNTHDRQVQGSVPPPQSGDRKRSRNDLPLCDLLERMRVSPADSVNDIIGNGAEAIKTTIELLEQANKGQVESPVDMALSGLKDCYEELLLCTPKSKSVMWTAASSVEDAPSPYSLKNLNSLLTSLNEGNNGDVDSNEPSRIPCSPQLFRNASLRMIEEENEKSEYEEALKVCYKYVRSCTSKELMADSGDTNAELTKGFIEKMITVLMHEFGMDEKKILLDIGCAYNVFATHIAQRIGCKVWGIEYVLPRNYLAAANFLCLMKDPQRAAKLTNTKIAYVPMNAIHFEAFPNTDCVYMFDEAFDDHPLMFHLCKAVYNSPRVKLVISFKGAKQSATHNMWHDFGFECVRRLRVKKHSSNEGSTAYFYKRFEDCREKTSYEWPDKWKSIEKRYLDPIWNGGSESAYNQYEHLLDSAEGMMTWVKRRRKLHKVKAAGEPCREQKVVREFTPPWSTELKSDYFYPGPPHRCNCLDCYSRWKQRNVLVIGAVNYDIATGNDPVAVLSKKVKAKGKKKIPASVARDTARCALAELDPRADYRVYTLAPKENLHDAIKAREDRHFSTTIGHRNMVEQLQQKLHQRPIHIAVLDYVWMPPGFVSQNFQGLARGLRDLWFNVMTERFKMIIVPLHKDVIKLLACEEFDEVLKDQWYLEVWRQDCELTQDVWSRASYSMSEETWDTFGKKKQQTAWCTKQDIDSLPDSALKRLILKRYANVFYEVFEGPAVIKIFKGLDESSCEDFLNVPPFIRYGYGYSDDVPDPNIIYTEGTHLYSGTLNREGLHGMHNDGRCHLDLSDCY